MFSLKIYLVDVSVYYCFLTRTRVAGGGGECWVTSKVDKYGSSVFWGHVWDDLTCPGTKSLSKHP